MTHHKTSSVTTTGLRNPKHEAFSRYSAAGLDAAEAYLAAGYPNGGRKVNTAALAVEYGFGSRDDPWQ
jgi:hypothetical protein